jgi:hypothetical protein
MSHIDALQISSGKADKDLTPQQKRFNKLIRQIEQARENLAAWRDGIALFRQVYGQVVQPLRDSLDEINRKWVVELDAALGQPGWTRAERETLREVLCDAAGAILDEREDDVELKALFDKHAEVDFDTERQEMLREMKGLTEAMTGLDLGDDDIRSDEELFRRMQQEMRAQHASAEAADAQRAAGTANRRKTAAQQRREDEARQATQSLREVFRKLASALHPDRETDPQQRAAKTALMQKVNVAYAANDLLALLELQLEIEHVDAGHVANASAARLKHYNKVLSEQLAELKTEVVRVSTGLRLEFGLDPFQAITPGKLGSLPEGHAKALRAELAQLQRDVCMLADKAATKRWLKRTRQQMREEDMGFGLF